MSWAFPQQDIVKPPSHHFHGIREFGSLTPPRHKDSTLSAWRSTCFIEIKTSNPELRALTKMDYSQCTHVTPQCPVEATTYGYYPNLSGNIILCVVFGICLILQLGLSIKGQTWTWMIGLFIGCGLEFAGYIGRILMHSNPWSQNAFRLQIITLILGPSFIAAGIDLTLKHLVIYFGPQYSLIRPVLYTWLFIGLDIFSILLQAAGGGIAASGDSAGANPSLLNSGNNLILAGIALQVAQLVAFGVVSVYYAFNVFRHRKTSERDGPRTPGSLKYFMFMIAVGYVFILLRCIYR